MSLTCRKISSSVRRFSILSRSATVRHAKFNRAASESSNITIRHYQCIMALTRLRMSYARVSSNLVDKSMSCAYVARVFLRMRPMQSHIRMRSCNYAVFSGQPSGIVDAVCVNKYLRPRLDDFMSTFVTALERNMCASNEFCLQANDFGCSVQQEDYVNVAVDPVATTVDLAPPDHMRRTLRPVVTKLEAPFRITPELLVDNQYTPTPPSTSSPRLLGYVGPYSTKEHHVFATDTVSLPRVTTSGGSLIWDRRLRQVCRLSLTEAAKLTGFSPAQVNLLTLHRDLSDRDARQCTSEYASSHATSCIPSRS